MRVLIIDDYEPITELLALWCRTNGFEAVTAVGGCQGLSRLAASPVDVVLVDVDMPGLGGAAVCRKIRAEGRWMGLPVVLMSGRALHELAGVAAACGADGVVAKPFDWERLRELLIGMAGGVEN